MCMSSQVFSESKWHNLNKVSLIVFFKFQTFPSFSCSKCSKLWCMSRKIFLARELIFYSCVNTLSNKR